MKIFAICYYAPPKLTPQSIQIGRQLYHMDAQVTLLHGNDPEFKDDYDQYPDFFQRIKSLCVLSPGTFFKGLAHRFARRLLPLYGTCPDFLAPWRRRALVVAAQHIKQDRPDAIVSFGVPMSDHLLALELKRRTGLPWLAHFSDPWANNPFHLSSALVRKVNALMEHQVIDAADRVLFTSVRTRDMVMSKYPEAWGSKAAVLPHAWDMDHFASARTAVPASVPQQEPDRRHVVRYIGACYGARSPEPLFVALGRMLERNRDALDNVRFEFVGALQRVFLESAAFKALPAGLVSIVCQVPYRESLRLASASAALLVIDAPSSVASVFLPSKLVEYIGARRPVWGITPHGTSADLIAEWAGNDQASASPDNIDGIVCMLEGAIARLDDGAAELAPEHIIQRFAAPLVAAALKGQVQHAIAHSDSRT